MKNDYWKTYRRWVLFIFAFICTSFVAGLIYGWPELRQQLILDGSELGEKKLGAIFTLGGWSTKGSRIFTGWVRDRIGTQKTVIFSMIIVMGGTLWIAWSDPNDAISLAVSIFFLGFGAGVQLCMLPVASLFPNHTGTVVTSLVGAFQISGLVFLTLTSMSSNRRTSFLGFSVCLLVLTIIAAFLLPDGTSFVMSDDDYGRGRNDDKTPLTRTRNTLQKEEKYGNISEANGNVKIKPSDDDGKYDNYGTNDQSSSGWRPSIKDDEEDLMQNEQKEDKQKKDGAAHDTPPPTAMAQIRSLEYVLLCTWFSICVIPLQYYVESIAFQLEAKGDDDNVYAGLFQLVYGGAFVFAPVSGYCADNFGLGVTQGIGTLLSAVSFFILASTRIGLDHWYGQIIGFASCSLGRMFVYGMFFSNIGKRFGYTNYGTLVGLGLFIGAIASLCQYPLIVAGASGYLSAVDMTCGSILVSLLPYCIWLHKRETCPPTTIISTQ